MLVYYACACTYYLHIKWNTRILTHFLRNIQPAMGTDISFITTDTYPESMRGSEHHNPAAVVSAQRYEDVSNSQPALASPQVCEASVISLVYSYRHTCHVCVYVCIHAYIHTCKYMLYVWIHASVRAPALRYARILHRCLFFRMYVCVFACPCMCFDSCAHEPARGYVSIGPCTYTTFMCTSFTSPVRLFLCVFVSRTHVYVTWCVSAACQQHR